jgi:hypothetical protein
VLIFSGPQDYLSYFNTPASWLSDSSQTDISRYFAFLHVRDPYDFRKQRIDCETLMQIKPADTIQTGHTDSLPVKHTVAIQAKHTGPMQAGHGDPMPVKESDTTMVSPGLAVKSGRHILVTNIETANPHGSVLNPAFRKVWEYMLDFTN